jgi:glycerophosphoryl diester phosphodiesterase
MAICGDYKQMSQNCKERRVTAIFAHRGCAGVPAPRENTIAAFVAARVAGADGVEMDVHATADGALAVHHDRHVPGVGDLANAPASALPNDVPTLAEALSACAGLRVNVEIKGGPGEAALVAHLLVSRAPGLEADGTGVFVSSFDPESLGAFRELAPAIPAGLLADWGRDARAELDHAARLGCATFHPFVTQVDAELVGAASTLGIGLHVWTVNADADIAAMGELGVDAIITDRVAAAVGILRPPLAGRGPGDRGDDAVSTTARNGGDRAG